MCRIPNGFKMKLLFPQLKTYFPQFIVLVNFSPFTTELGNWDFWSLLPWFHILLNCKKSLSGVFPQKIWPPYVAKFPLQKLVHVWKDTFFVSEKEIDTLILKVKIKNLYCCICTKNSVIFNPSCWEKVWGRGGAFSYNN